MVYVVQVDIPNGGDDMHSGARTPPDEDPTDDDKCAVIDDTGSDTPSAPTSAPFETPDGAQHYDPASTS